MEDQEVVEQEVVETETGSSEESESEQLIPPEGEEQEVSEGEEVQVNEDSEIEKLRKQLAHAESLLGRHSQEVGISRSKIAELEQEVTRLRQARQELQDEGLPDTFQAIENYQALSNAERELAELQQRQIIEGNKLMFGQIAPEYEKMVDKMSEFMLRDGYNPQEVAAFKSNPYAVDQGIAIAYINQVKAANQIEEMKEKIERLNPSKIGKKLQEAASTQSVRVSTGGSSSGEVEVTPAMIRGATSKQRQHFIKTGEWINP